MTPYLFPVSSPSPRKRQKRSRKDRPTWPGTCGQEFEEATGKEGEMAHHHLGNSLEPFSPRMEQWPLHSYRILVTLRKILVMVTGWWDDSCVSGDQW